MDHGLDVERRVQKDLLRLARELGLPLVATNDLHYTSPEDAKAHSALLCVQSGSTMMDPNRFKFDADDFYLKSPAEMRHTWRELPEACDNTLLIAEMCDISFTEDEGRYMPRFPCPPGRERGELVRQGGRRRGLRERFPERHPRLRPEAGRVRDRRHRLQGVRRLLPRRRRLHHLGQEQRHPGRSGSWLGCRLDVRLRHEDHRPRPDPARADLRAVPQPRASVAARLRRRLRRAPARRGDPLRHREVRQRAGRADRHLRHHQGQAGRQGRRPRHGPPVRGGRAAHQGDAAGRHGQGRAARRASTTRSTRATARARSSASSSPPSRTCRRSSRPPRASRASSASGACTPPASS